MTEQRALAYAAVLRLLEEVGPERLRADEAAAAREAADALLFCADLGLDDEARGALDHLEDLLERVVDDGRLRLATAEALLVAVEACGPGPVRAPL